MHEGPLVVGDDADLARIVVVVQFGSAQREVPQHPTEGQFQVFAREGGFGRAIGQHRALDQHRPVAEIGHRAKVVGRHQHDPAFVAQLAQKLR